MGPPFLFNPYVPGLIMLSSITVSLGSLFTCILDLAIFNFGLLCPLDLALTFALGLDCDRLGFCCLTAFILAWMVNVSLFH